MDYIDPKVRAENQGETAYRIGLKITDNPYKRKPLLKHHIGLHDLWNKGFNKAYTSGDAVD